MKADNSKKPMLYICPTPIGNLGDISSRLAEVLRTVDIVFAEDTRVTKKLLNHIESRAEIRRLDENTMQNRLYDVFAAINDGKSCAYCTDAGVPGVSDPGLALVAAARTRGISVDVLPGPCAAINAYVASGFENSKFYFGGFFPRKKAEIQKTLEELAAIDAILIFYESPKRLVSTLSVIADIDAQRCAQREISVCRELTKIHEEIVVARAKEVYDDFASREQIKGECVICIDNSHNISDADKDNYVQATTIENLIKSLLNEGIKCKTAAKIASETLNISKNEAYEISLKLHKK